jgi:hypothetical protein
MVIKHAQQSTVKWQENTLSPEACGHRWKQFIPLLDENCHLYGFKDRMECQFHATSLLCEVSPEVIEDLESAIYLMKLLGGRMRKKLRILAVNMRV